MVLTHMLNKNFAVKTVVQRSNILQCFRGIVTLQMLVNNLLTTCSKLGIIGVSTKFVKINCC